DGSSEEQPLLGFGERQQNFLDRSQESEKSIEFYSAVLSKDFANVNLTSVTGYSNFGVRYNFDRGYAFGGLTLARHGTSDVTSEADAPTEKFSQEVRLAGKALGDRLSWLTGLYYSDESTHTVQYFFAGNGATQQIVAVYGHLDTKDKFEEYAG